MIAVVDSGDRSAVSAVAAWANAAASPVLVTSVGADVALVGPLTLPGRVGCAHCAQERIRAAAAGSGRELANVSAVETRAQAAQAQTIVGWVETCERDPESSPLLDHVLQVDTDGASRHMVLPLAECPICGGAQQLDVAARDARRARSTTDASHATPFAGWLDPLTGVVPALQLDTDAGEGAGLPYVVTTAPPHVPDAGGGLRRLPLGWGKGLALSAAVTSALGEAVERYCASLPDPARLVWRRIDDLDGERLDPREFALYDDEQYERDDFPYVRFDPAVLHPWVQGRRLGTDEPVWVPAIFAYLSLTLGPENMICQGTSNGLAAGRTYADAAQSAILELIERDALMCAWLTATPAQPVAFEVALEPRLEAALARIDELGGSTEVYLLPNSLAATTALCLAIGDGRNWPGITLGLGADLDPARAVEKAILELYQTGPHLRSLLQRKRLRAPASERDVVEMIDHAAFYFQPERLDCFASLRSRRACPPATIASARVSPAPLDELHERLTAAAVPVALVDVTSPDAQLGGFQVIRAVSPQLQAISFGYGNDRAPIDRIVDNVRSVAPIHPIW